jgi:hypothetical protein
MHKITFTLAWNRGGAIVVTCSESTTLQEVVRDLGFTCDPLFISQGRTLDPDFTIRHHQLKNGQKVIAYLRKASIPAAPQYFSKWTPLMQSRTLAKLTEHEIIREVDRAWQRWELKRNATSVMTEILSRIEASEIQKAAVKREETIISPATDISECPLPSLISHEQRYRRTC